MEIAGKTVLVSGGSSGLGAACVRRFAELGARVLIADVNAAAGQQLADELSPNVGFAAVDVTSADDVHRAIATARQQFGGLDAVINCAGILGAARILGRDGPHLLEVFSRVIHVNLVGTFNLLRLAADSMVHNEMSVDGERGVIINTASIAAFEGQVGQVAYAASKGGVAALTLPAARELARIGIRVMAIAPGMFETPMVQGMPDSVRQSLIAQTVFPKRLGLAEEYAALAQHIVENLMLNGTVIRLDGAVRLAMK